ncbi:MAG: AEC family transporter [Peptococcales bacterium]|jgi:predicted permease
MVFINVILPMLIISVFGFWLQKKFRLDLKTVSTISLYVFLPALVFKTLYEAKWDMSFIQISFYSIFLLIGLLIVNFFLTRFLKITDPERTAFVLSTSFMNNGNIGVPLALLALGQRAFEYSVVIMIVHTILMSTIGIYIAARGKASWKTALEKVFFNPVIHAVYLPLFFKILNISFPEPLFKIVDMFAAGAIPLIMITLSMQLAEITVSKVDRVKIPLALLVRLIISPLLVFIILSFIPLDPLLEKVMILQAATPTAAIITIYALEYDVLPDVVSSITLLSTIVSMLTLSLILTLMI